MFIVISGVSGSGKDTVMHRLTEEIEDIQVLTYSSATTRPERATDKEDCTYVFYTEAEFKRLMEEGKLFEHNYYSGNYYGLLLSRLEDVVNDQKTDYMRDVEVNGTVALRKYFAKQKCPLLTIFIDVPNDVLIDRLHKRGETEESIQKRIERGPYERSFKRFYDLCVDNIELETTVETIKKFILEKREILKK